MSLAIRILEESSYKGCHSSCCSKSFYNSVSMDSKTQSLFFCFWPSLFLLVHIISAAAAGNVIKAGYWYKTNQVIISPQDQPQFSNFTRTVQQRNPFVKTLLSIGGASASSRAAFASMASQPSSRKTFIDSSINISRSYNFHGLDIDWEFPATANFGTLLAEWRGGVTNDQDIWQAPIASSGSGLLLCNLRLIVAPHSVHKKQLGLDQYDVI